MTRQLTLAACLAQVLCGGSSCSFQSSHGAGTDGDNGGGLVICYEEGEHDHDLCDGFESPADSGGDTGPSTAGDPVTTLVGAGVRSAWHPIVPVLAQDAYRPSHYRVILSDTPGRHPVAAITDIEGLSLKDTWGPGNYGPEQIDAFARSVLTANAELLGPGIENLLSESVLFDDHLVIARFVQELSTDLVSADVIPETEVLVVFDGLGRLVHIKNSTCSSPAPGFP
jgi:hypothetical protein